MRTRVRQAPDRIPTITQEDAERIARDLLAIGGPHVSWGAHQTLEVWLVEQRMRADRASAAALSKATWMLVAVTFALVLATVVLVVVTAHGG